MTNSIWRPRSLDSALGEKRAVRIGLVFMGRQAAGVHCVAAGVFDSMFILTSS